MTPVQRRMLNKLEERPRSARELLICLEDELAEVRTVYVHVCRLRSYLKRHQNLTVKFSRGKYQILTLQTTS